MAGIYMCLAYRMSFMYVFTYECIYRRVRPCTYISRGECGPWGPTGRNGRVGQRGKNHCAVQPRGWSMVAALTLLRSFVHPPSANALLILYLSLSSHSFTHIHIHILSTSRFYLLYFYMCSNLYHVSCPMWFSLQPPWSLHWPSPLTALSLRFICAILSCKYIHIYVNMYMWIHWSLGLTDSPDKKMALASGVAWLTWVFDDLARQRGSTQSDGGGTWLNLPMVK